MLHAKTPDQINNYLKYQCDVKRSFIVRSANGVKTITWNKKKNFGMIFKNKLSPDQLKTLWVFSVVRRQVLKRLTESEKLNFMQKPLASQKKNFALYKKLRIGTEFVAIDLNHAYWRVAFLKGYISSDLYHKLLDTKFKLVRNKALACLTSKIKTEEYRNGKLVSTKKQADPLLVNAYADIRYSTYKVMLDIAKEIKENNFLKYHTDCLYVTLKMQKKVEQMLASIKIARQLQGIKENTFSYKSDKCVKVSNTYFIQIEDKKNNEKRF